MIDLEIIQGQINSLQRCVDNCNSAKKSIQHLESIYNNYYDMNSYSDDMKEANDQLSKCEQTILGQLKVNYIQNQDLIKS